MTIDPSDKEEFNAIRVMLKRAAQNHLETEVIASFANELRVGEKDIRKAAIAAMREWDTLTFNISRVEDPNKTDKVLVEHTWALESPTKRGKKSETNKTDTEMHVSREGCLSIISYDQADAFGKPAIVKNIGEK